MRFQLKWKHVAATIFGGVIAIPIYIINNNLGNPDTVSVPISVFLFGIAYIPFAITWEVKNTWRARWTGYEHSFPQVPGCARLEAFEVPPMGGKKLHGHLLFPLTADLPPRDCVLLLHGYSDTQSSLAFIAGPLLQQGHCVAVYDARGVGASRATGSRNDFFAQVNEDFPRVLAFLQAYPSTSNLSLMVVGFSMGANAPLVLGVTDPQITKVVGVSAAADHKRNLPPTIRLFSAQFWLRIRYKLLGLKTNWPDAINEQISPAPALQKSRAQVSPATWSQMVNNRVFLVHVADDKVVTLDKQRKNAAVMNLPPSQVFVLSKGGHTALRAELLLVSTILHILE